MKSTASVFQSAACCVAALLFLVIATPARAQLSAGYVEPDLTTPVFDVSHLSLDAPARGRLATILAAAVTNYDPILDAKILGIALRLDPASRPALAASARRKRGELPDPRRGDTVYPVETVVTYFAGQSAGLRAKDGTDNRLLAGFLSEIAVSIAPDNTIAKYEQAAFARNNPAPVWSFLRLPTPSTVGTLPIQKRESRIHGLGIIELRNGDRTGSVMEMTIVAAKAYDPKEVGVTVSEVVGESMQHSLNDAWRSVKLRHPAFGDGQKLILTFTNDHHQKDGPSAGTAFTLLLYSLYDSLRIAEDCAVTGAVNVDGHVSAVGGVPSKINAALQNGCHIVAIPKENASAVSDLPILFPQNILWKIQVITVENLDEALAVMREDRPADLQKAIDRFAALQKKIGLETPHLSSAHSGLMPELREILRLAPGHASAGAILKFLEGKLSPNLSLYASLDEVTRITRATLASAHSDQTQGENFQEVIAGGVTRLENLRPHLDYRIADLCAADLAAFRELQSLEGRLPSREWFVQYRERVRVIEETEVRISTDLGLLDALYH